MLDAKVLCVDDDVNVGRGCARILHKLVHVDVAQTARQAMDLMRSEGPYAVVVSDQRMPRVSGLELLEWVREQYPDTVRIMLTGNIDQVTASVAINDAGVFRFLLKPCDAKTLGEAVVAGVRHHEERLAERRFMEETLSGVITMLSEILSVVNPQAFGRVPRLEALVGELLGAVGRAVDWDARALPLLALVGCVGLSPTAQARLGGRGADAADGGYAELSARLVGAIPRLEGLAEAIRYQLKDFDGGGLPVDDVAGERIPFLARVLRVALAFDDALERTRDRRLALAALREQTGRFDPGLLDALDYPELEAPPARAPSPRPLKSPPRAKPASPAPVPPAAVDDAERPGVPMAIIDLDEGMVLAEAVVTSRRAQVMAAGQELTEAAINRLAQFAKSGQIPSQVRIVPSAAAAPADDAAADAAEAAEATADAG